MAAGNGGKGHREPMTDNVLSIAGILIICAGGMSVVFTDGIGIADHYLRGNKSAGKSAYRDFWIGVAIMAVGASLLILAELLD